MLWIGGWLDEGGVPGKYSEQGHYLFSNINVVPMALLNSPLFEYIAIKKWNANHKQPLSNPSITNHNPASINLTKYIGYIWLVTILTFLGNTEER